MKKKTLNERGIVKMYVKKKKKECVSRPLTTLVLALYLESKHILSHIHLYLHIYEL
jgi:hypothetical protein